ncbi:restriction endonuclease subunit S [Megasphaera sp.]|uniref:restriction endonuclease subunit S n=1 Tax=Megasphaera sp. TaxID=2023260 RepID=UPI00266BB745|nr:restriction endonuclease subunit S [uncultured Megasphaera sp.]
MKKYSNVMNTNVTWIPQIPAHWKLQKINALFTERKKKVSDKDYKPLSVTKKGILPQLAHAAKSNDSDNRKLVKAGDFVINSRSDRKGSCGVSKLDGSVSLINIVLTPRNELNSEYIHYLLRNYRFSEEYYRNGRGIVADLWTTRYSEMRTILIPVPPRAEQDQIVRFLDWKVSEINRLIRIKKNQINGYREYEKKVINDKVLYGLQEAPLRESGNYWVGKIPTNWKIIKLGKFCSFQNGISESGNFFTSGTPFVGYSDVYRHLEIPKYVKGVAKANEQQQEIFSVRKGDIFFTRTSESIEEIGMAAVCKHTIKDAVFSGFLIRCRPRMPLINEDYMKYYLQIPAVRNHFSSMMNIVIRASLGQNLLKQMPVVVPPLKEQKEIAEFLDAMHERFLRLITTNEEEISMLEVLRSTLISDVVTGKIDVRNIPVPAYEHVDDMVADDGEGNDEETGIPGEED